MQPKMTIEQLLSEDFDQRVARHEGKKYKVYFDQFGNPTIGIGRNLNAGLTDDEVMYLYRNSKQKATNDCFNNLTWLTTQPKIIQEVLIEMCFQMGIVGLLQFHNFLGMIQVKQYKEAAKDGLDSLWAKQAPERVQELMELVASAK